MAEDRPKAEDRQREGKPAESDQVEIGKGGERLTRDEAFELLRRAATTLIKGEGAVSAATIRKRAFELLGRDSESLNARFFDRVLRDAHDNHVIDLRRRGDDYEVSLPTEVAPVAEQLNRAAAAHVPAVTAAAAAPAAPRRGMGPRGIPSRGRGGRGAAPPAELLSVGVVDHGPAAAAAPAAPAVDDADATGAAPRAAKGRARGGGAKKAAAKKKKVAAAPETAAQSEPSGTATATKKRAPRKKKASAASGA